MVSLLHYDTIHAQQVTKHTVETGETLSKIASNYGTTVGDIMRFNGMNSKSKLEVGQSIKIPPAGVHIIGKVAEENKTTSTPVTNVDTSGENVGKTHTVVAGESLYKISRSYNIKVADLRKWNNLADNNIKVGQILQMSSVPAATSKSGSTITNVPETNTSGTIVGNDKIGNSNKSVKEDSVKVISTETTNLATNSGGAFANAFGQDVENMTLTDITGKAKVFKSQSGWTDQKFYIMMNDVTPGAVVKVTYNGASVFAKVLWNLIDTKENTGLAFRISDATASALGATSADFDLKVDYYK